MPKIFWSERKCLSHGVWLLAYGLATAPVCVASEASLQSSLIDRPSIGDLSIYGVTSGKSLIPTTAIPGQSAVRIEVPSPVSGNHPWDIGVGAATTADINKGDRVVVDFWARAELGTGQVVARMQSNDSPYSGIVQADIHPSSAWTLFQLDGVADQDYLAGHTGMTLSLSTQQQILDIGPIYIFKNPDISGNLKAPLLAIPLSRARDAVIETPDGLKLAATLRTPPGDGPFPAVLIVTGSGPWGRNPSDPISQALLSYGNAVLQFDKRGVGQSTGKLDGAQTSDLAHDADVIARWLRQQPEITPGHTGILGASQGGMIAISVAADDKEVSFVVDLAGPAEPMGDLGIRQNELAWLDAGSPPDKVAEVIKMFRDGLAALRAATSNDDAVARTKAALAPYVGSLISQADIDKTAEMFRDPSVRAQYLYDPKAELERVRVPVLGIYGSMDHQVPAEENAAALRKGLAANKDVTVLILPGFNHLFQHAKIGNTAEWETLKEPQFNDPELHTLITNWVTKHTK